MIGSPPLGELGWVKVHTDRNVLAVYLPFENKKQKR